MQDETLKDETLTCRDCGQNFLFSVKDQKFFKKMGFTSKPTRCLPCRKAKKAQREAHA